MSDPFNKYRSPVVVCDVDGVVADWFFSATQITKALFGVPEYPRTCFEATGWDFDWLGLGREEKQKFWAAVRDSEESFWANERELIPGIIREMYSLSSYTTWYWCTTRDDTKAASAKSQTERFFARHGFPNATVVVSDEKGVFCKSVSADVFIDDKFSNCKKVIEQSPDTRVIYVSLLFGREYEEEANRLGMWVVRTHDAMQEAIATCKRRYWKQNED